jgi:hypothetical protein
MNLCVILTGKFHLRSMTSETRQVKSTKAAGNEFLSYFILNQMPLVFEGSVVCFHKDVTYDMLTV